MAADDWHCIAHSSTSSVVLTDRLRLRVEAARAEREVLRPATVLDQLPGHARRGTADDAVVGGRVRVVGKRVAVEAAAPVAGLGTRFTPQCGFRRAGLGLRS